MSSDPPVKPHDLKEDKNNQSSHDQKQQPLTPQEIERICRAFIRLITAVRETPTHLK